LYQLFLAGKFQFVRSDIFAVGRIALETDYDGQEKRVEENANVSFFETQTTTRALVYRTHYLLLRTLLVTLEWIEFGHVHKI